MNRLNHRISVHVVTIAVLLVAIAGYETLAQRAVAPGPLVIATVRIDALFDGLQQRAEAKAEVAALEAELQGELTARQQEITALEEKLEDVVAAARRDELMDQITLARMRLQLWQQSATAELEVEKAIRLQYLYQSLRAAIKALADDEGYDLVLLNDSSDELPFDREARVPAQLQILQQVSNRKILYVNSAVDITEDLIIRMNNALRAGP